MKKRRADLLLLTLIFILALIVITVFPVSAETITFSDMEIATEITSGKESNSPVGYFFVGSESQKAQFSIYTKYSSTYQIIVYVNDAPVKAVEGYGEEKITFSVPADYLNKGQNSIYLNVIAKTNNFEKYPLVIYGNSMITFLEDSTYSKYPVETFKDMGTATVITSGTKESTPVGHFTVNSEDQKAVLSINCYRDASYKAIVYVNDAPVKVIDGYGEEKVTFTMPADSLRVGSNSIYIKAIAETGDFSKDQMIIYGLSKISLPDDSTYSGQEAITFSDMRIASVIISGTEEKTPVGTFEVDSSTQKAIFTIYAYRDASYVATVYVNDAPVKSIDGNREEKISFTMPGGSLKPGPNTVYLNLVAKTGDFSKDHVAVYGTSKLLLSEDTAYIKSLESSSSSLKSLSSIERDITGTNTNEDNNFDESSAMNELNNAEPSVSLSSKDVTTFADMGIGALFEQGKEATTKIGAFYIDSDTKEIEILVSSYRDYAYQLTIYINGAPVKSVEASGENSLKAVIPLENLKVGVNTIYVKSSARIGTFDRVSMVIYGTSKITRIRFEETGTDTALLASTTERVQSNITTIDYQNGDSSGQQSSNNYALTESLPIVLVVLLVIVVIIRGFKKGTKNSTHIDNQTVINNIHYGNKIQTNIRDSVVQRSNFGSGYFPCPQCGSAIAEGGHYCVECGNMVK